MTPYSCELCGDAMTSDEIRVVTAQTRTFGLDEIEVCPECFENYEGDNA